MKSLIITLGVSLCLFILLGVALVPLFGDKDAAITVAALSGTALIVGVGRRIAKGRKR